MANSYANNYLKTPTRKTGEQMRAERLMREQYKRDNAIMQAQAIKQAEEERRNAGFLKRAASTVGDLLGNIGGGLVGLGEGVFDAGVGIVGGIGSLFGADNKWASDIVSYDFTGENIYKPLQELQNDSYLQGDVGNFIRDGAKTIGQMLPTVAAVAATAATGGAAAPLIPVAMGAQVASAGGSGMQEALNDGASYNQALAYGGTQSGIELAAELVSGGYGRLASLGGKMAVKGLAKNIAKEAGSEFIEEAFGDLVNPITKAATYKGAEELNRYKDPTLYTGAVRSGMLGALGGAFSAGAGAAVRVKQSGGIDQFTITDIQQQKSEFNGAVDKLQASGKLTDSGIENYISAITDADNRQAERIAKLDIAKQTDYVKQYGEPTGFTMTENGLTRTNMQEDLPRLTELKQAVKSQTMSASILANPKNLAFAPTQKVNEYVKETLKTVSALAEKGKGLPTVLTDGLPSGTYGQVVNGVSYINAKMPTDKIMSQAVIHEFTHSLEGSKQYANFAETILNHMQQTDPNFAANVESTRVAYAEQLKDLSPETQDYIIQTELVSNYASTLFTDVEQIKRIANTNKSLATKILDWIKNKISLLKAKKGGAEKYAALRFLQQAETLYTKAVSSSQGGVSISAMDKAVKDGNAKQTTPVDEVRYSKTLTFDEQVDRVANGTFDKAINYLHIGGTPQIYLKYGLNDLPLLMPYSKAYGAIFESGEIDENYHKFGTELLKQIPTSLKDPEYIFKGQKDNKIEALLFIKDYKGDKILVPIEFSTKVQHNEHWIEANVILTAFGKRKFDKYILTKENAQEILYKKKSSPLQVISRGQFPSDINNDKPTNSIRQETEKVNSLDKNKLDPNTRYSLSPQNTKTIANVKMDKVYTKKEISVAVDGILEDVLSNGDYQAALTGAKKQSVIDTLFNSFNTSTGSKRAAVANDIAKYLIDETALESIYKADIREEALENSTRIINAIRGYVGALDLTNIKSELEYEYDVKGAKGVMLGWSKKGGMGADVAAQELSEQGIIIKAQNEADAFIEIKKLYDDAKSAIKTEADSDIREIYGADEVASLQEQITKDILAASDNIGKPSFKASLLKSVDLRLNKLKKELKEVKIRAKVMNGILDSAATAREIDKKTGFTSAAVFNDSALKDMVKLVAGFKSRTEIANGEKRGARQRAVQLSKIYNKDNPLLFSESESLNMIDDNVVDALALLSKNADVKNVKFSLDELRALDVVAKGIIHLYKTYDNIFIDGKLKNLTEIAESGIVQAQTRARAHKKVGFFSGVKSKLNELIMGVADPTAVMRNLDGYAVDGAMTKLWDSVKDGETMAGIAAMDLVDPLEQFLHDNKGYAKHLDEEIMVDGKTFTVNQALALYLLSKREQAHLFKADLWLEQKNGDVKYRITSSDITEIYAKFTAEDKKYLEISHDMFNDKAKKLKMETDMLLLGYTNVEDGDNYIPIRRDAAGVAQNLTDTVGIVNEVAAANNKSFNMNVKPNAQNAIYLDGLSTIMDKHIRGVSMYYGLAVPLKNFNRVYNKVVKQQDTNVKTSMREILTHNTSSGTIAYIKKLFADIQGMGKTKTAADKVLSYMRGAYAKFQLGANPKTVLSQLSSYPMALTYLDASCLAKGLSMKADKESMLKYCPQARFRMNDKSIVKAQGALDKIGKVGDIATKPIQMMDNLTVTKLWSACQAQTEKDGNGAIGSEQNLTAAGKLLDKVIRETQSNSIMSERSGMSRSNNFLVSSFTMFMSDATKQFSRLYDCVGELSMLKFKIKEGDASAETAQQYNVAKKRLRRTVTAVAMSNLVYVMIGMLFKWLYDKERKDKKGKEIGFAQDFIGDYASSMIGMMPVIRDIYGMLSNDFEVNNYALGMINDLIKSTKGIGEVVGGFIDGKDMTTTELLKPLRDTLYAIGQATGVPIRNVYNMIYGLTKRFNPEAAYKVNSLFYNNNSYKSDMQKATEQGKPGFAKTIAEAELAKRGIKNANVKKELADMMAQGVAMPIRDISSKITIENESMELTPKQQKAIKQEYLKLEDELIKLLSTPDYTKLSPELKPKTIQYISDLYYAKAIKTILGADILTPKQSASESIPPHKLAIYLTTINGITPDKDNNGETIPNSKKSKVYKYVNSLQLTTAQKLTLMELAGYKVVDKALKAV